MNYDLPKERGSNLTIIGAITSKKDKIYHEIYNSTNIDNFKDFLIKLDNEIELKDKVIVLDNHRAHHSNIITNFIN